MAYTIFHGAVVDGPFAGLGFRASGVCGVFMGLCLKAFYYPKSGIATPVPLLFLYITISGLLSCDGRWSWGPVIP